MEAGATWQRSADIFAHTLLHERQHHADVHTLLYQLGIEGADRAGPVLAP